MTRHQIRFVLLVMLLSLLPGSLMAQNIRITGKVVDSNNVPLAGVYIVIERTSTGTSTMSDGTYSINAPGNANLIFSQIGMTTVTVPVNNRSVINISMTDDAIAFQDVVVVGYGTQRRENLTGAVATVDTKMLEARPIADAGRGLQGLAPGLNVTIPSGEVGSDPIMKIRGTMGSIDGGSAPLILLDNVEIPSIQMINPEDIESISILKDAASSSIYGSKAAFGVILITSKKGASVESVNVSYSGNISFQNISKKMEMAGLDGMEYSENAMRRFGATVVGAFIMTTSEGYEKAKKWQSRWGNVVGVNDPYVYGRDWYVDVNNRKIGLRPFDPYDYMVREWAPTHTHNVSVNGKSGRTSYNMSMGYMNQQGMMKPAKKDDFTRYNGSVRVTTDINDYIQVYAGALYSKRNKQHAYVTNSFTADPWLYLYRWSSFYPMVDDENGNPLRSPAYEIAAANTANQETNYLNMTGGITITPTANWNIKFDYSHANQEYIWNRPGTRFNAGDTWVSAVAKNDASGNRIYVNDAGQVVSASTDGAMPAYMMNKYEYTSAGNNPDHIRRESRNDQWNTLNITTTYDLNINEIHDFKFMLGGSRHSYVWEDNWSQITNLTDITNPQFDLTQGTQTASGNTNWNSQVGFFGRINYAFKNKYLLEGNLRYDGSSKFPGDLKWRWFPSFSAGWRVHEEPWMQWSSNVLSSLKLRGSWGSIGDQTVSNELYIPTLTGSQISWLINNNKITQFSTPTAVSDAITWQDITTLNLGFDARLFRKLGVSFDWFRRDTENMIVPTEGIPYTYGVGAPKGNFGSLRTTGVELQLDFNHTFTNGLGISVVATMADAVTKVSKYGSVQSITGYYVGKTIGEIWGYETDRLYQKGDFVYNGNTLVTEVVGGQTINKLSDPNGATQERLQSGNFRFGPGDVKYKDLDGDGKITPGDNTIGSHGDKKIIGNSTPRYEYSLRLGLNYKGFDASVFMQGIGKRDVWGAGFLAIPGFNSSDGAMPQAFAGDFWREDRTNAFYPAPANMGGTADIWNMQPQTKYLLNMAYFRIKNITVGYTIPKSITQKIYLKGARVYVSLENFFTFDKLGSLPIDPEEVAGYSMWNTTNYNASRTGVGTPTFKSASFGIQLNF